MYKDKTTVSFNMKEQMKVDEILGKDISRPQSLDLSTKVKYIIARYEEEMKKIDAGFTISSRDFLNPIYNIVGVEV